MGCDACDGQCIQVMVVEFIVKYKFVNLASGCHRQIQTIARRIYLNIATVLPLSTIVRFATLSIRHDLISLAACY